MALCTIHLADAQSNSLTSVGPPNTAHKVVNGPPLGASSGVGGPFRPPAIVPVAPSAPRAVVSLLS